MSDAGALGMDAQQTQESDQQPQLVIDELARVQIPSIGLDEIQQKSELMVLSHSSPPQKPPPSIPTPAALQWRSR